MEKKRVIRLIIEDHEDVIYWYQLLKSHYFLPSFTGTVMLISQLFMN